MISFAITRIVGCNSSHTTSG